MATNRPHTLAKVLYNYSATSSTELTITKGQTIRVYEKFKKGWWTGEDENGKVGLFPGSYVRELKDRSSTVLSPAAAASAGKSRPLSEMPAQASPAGDVQYCKAKEGHVAKHSKQLSFKAGDVITLHEKYVTGWWKGELNGSVGMFPSTAIEIVAEKPETEAVTASASVVASASPAASEEAGVARSESGSKKRRKPIARAKVLYDYMGATATELTVKKGDVVNVLKKIPDSGWWQGELDGKVGHFPCKYVKELEDSASENAPAAAAVPAGAAVAPAASPAAASPAGKVERGTVLYDFQAVEASELPLRKGNIVTVLERGDAGGWWKGELNGAVGHFPGQYVKLIVPEGSDASAEVEVSEEVTATKEAEGTPSKKAKEKKKKAKKSVDSPAKAAEGKSKGKGKAKSKKEKKTKAKSRTDEATRKAAEAMSKADELSKKAEAAQKKAELAKRNADLHSTFAVGKYDYEAKTETELSFKAGDSIRVIEVLPSGWWKGELKGKAGHFPGSYVREAKSQATRVRALYSYVGQTKTELSFKKGDVLIKLHDVGEGWCKGEFQGKRGHYPSNYAIEIEDTDKEATAAAAAAAAAEPSVVTEPVRVVDEAAPKGDAPAPEPAAVASSPAPAFADEPEQQPREISPEEDSAEPGSGLSWPEEEGSGEELVTPEEEETVAEVEAAAVEPVVEADTKLEAEVETETSREVTVEVTPAEPEAVAEKEEEPEQKAEAREPAQKEELQEQPRRKTPPPVVPRQTKVSVAAPAPTASPAPAAAVDNEVLAAILAKQEQLEQLVKDQAREISSLREEVKQLRTAPPARAATPPSRAANFAVTQAQQKRQSVSVDGSQGSALDDPSITPTLTGLRKQLKAETRNRRELELITRKLESEVEVLTRTLERVQREMAEQFTLEQIGQQRLKRTGRDLTS